MKNMICFLLILLTACSNGDKIKTEQYKTNHIEFHKTQLDFMKRQTKLIEDEFSLFFKHMGDKEDSDVVKYDWDLLNEYVNEMRFKNEVFINDMIPSDSAVSIICDMRDCNLEMSHAFLLKEAFMEEYIQTHQYETAKSVGNEIRTEALLKIEKVRQGAQDYLKICSS
ncbi:MAG TPA: hypothetical protein VFJ43_12775 [Bacteroidia bacterium]|nr:hypothetical protein [Bacteroidia bacterium]